MYNPLLNTDSYKLGPHALMLPKGSQYVHSYIESRGGIWDRSVFFGLQYIIGQISHELITRRMLMDAVEFGNQHGVRFNEEGFDYLLKRYGHENGNWMSFKDLPIRIRAVPEGSVIPNHNVLLTIENTDPEVPWLPGFLETLLMQLWYPISVATLSYHCKRTIMDAYYKSSELDPKVSCDFSLQDFGFRGSSSLESAAIGGAAHLVNFKGSDTIPGIRLLQEVYHAKEMPGFSVTASEHSVMTSWGGVEGETASMANILDTFTAPNALIAIVCDSFSLRNAINVILGEKLKDKVLKLGGMGGRLIVRPDSGNPIDVVTETCQMIASKFGSSSNKKGYTVLPPYIRMIQGDGINESSMKDILNHLIKSGFSAENVTFGMGGGLLTSTNRDSLKFAMKMSSIIVDGVARDVFKAPEDDLTKHSKKGKLDLVLENGQYKTVPFIPNNPNTVMQTVWENGVVKLGETLENIRTRVNEHATDGLYWKNFYGNGH